MKKLLALAGIAAAMMLAVSCDPENNNDDDKDVIEINPENLAGTWEGGVEHDFAQGYPQNWRIQID